MKKKDAYKTNLIPAKAHPCSTLRPTGMKTDADFESITRIFHPNKMWRRNLRTVYFVGCVTALVILTMACSSSPVTSSDSKLSPAPGASPVVTVPIRIDATSLFSEYDTNDTAANSKYKGKQLEVSGVITDIGSDMFGNPTVLFGMKDGERTGVLSIFGKDTAASVAGLSEGQKVTILGVCDGLRIYVILKYAAIVK